MAKVFIVLEAWGEDPPEARRAFASEAAADRYIEAENDGADDYTLRRRWFFLKVLEVEE